MRRRHLAPAVAGLVLAAVAPATVAQARIPAPEPPMLLPGDARASSLRADPTTWIVGADARSPRSAAIARRFGARPAGGAATTFAVAPARAAAFARALRRAGLLVYAEPNGRATYAARLSDPLTTTSSWRDVIVAASLTAPKVTPKSPKLVLIDTQIDLTHPEIAGTNIRSTLHNRPTSPHGTATVGVAAAPDNNIGFVGVWPNMRAYNYATGTLTCLASARQISRAVKHGAAVISMSYGSDAFCYSEFVALQKAFAKGVVTVAAAGNEFEDGNPLEYPASLPHVLTVSAVGPDNRVSPFSNTNAAVDVSAPGTGVLTSVPPAFDDDGPRDGFAYLSGTSFSAPMIAAGAAWVRQVRPGLDAGQVGQAIRFSANDVQSKGWDAETGYGIISVRRALKIREPPADSLEPNDGIVWVDGRAFGRPDVPIFPKGARLRTLDALVDQYEDPDDVYRVEFAPRARLRFDVKPRFGDVDLEIYQGAAKTFSNRFLIDRSEKNGTALDRIFLTNRTNRATAVYVHVYINPALPTLNADYRLRIVRLSP